MPIALVLITAISVVGACVYVYLTGRDRNGWAKKLNEERAAYDAQERELVSRIERLTAENHAHVQSAFASSEQIASLTAEVDQQAARADSAESAAKWHADRDKSRGR